MLTHVPLPVLRRRA